MKGKRFADEQIAYALRQAEGGTPVSGVCRQLGVSEASFYVWTEKYGKIGQSELRELRQLRDESARLKRLVADLTLDKHILGGSRPKKCMTGPVFARHFFGGCGSSVCLNVSGLLVELCRLLALMVTLAPFVDSLDLEFG